MIYIKITVLIMVFSYTRNSDFYKRLDVLGHKQYKNNAAWYIKDIEIVNYID